MLEDDRRSNPLIDQVINQRRAKQAQEQSEAQAKEMLPDFKEELGALITAKIPAPEVIIEKVTSLRNNIVQDDAYNPYGRPRKLKTTLTATVPLVDGGNIQVTISASRYPGVVYPDDDEPVLAKDLGYQIDVAELDSILIIGGSDATVQSKKWEGEPFTMHTPIGVPLPSWPSWERRVKAEDIEQYQMLLAGLNQEGVTFEGFTPPIIKRDYSEWRARYIFPNTH